jgi:biotin carboxyl carrier protein
MTSQYGVTVDGRTVSVEIENVEGGVRVKVDGRERVLDARELAGGVWSILDGATAHLVQVDGVPPKLTVEVSHADGESRTCQVAISERRSGSAVGSAAIAGGEAGRGPTMLRAPIPGRLVKLLVKVGDAVTAGQSLLVLEAMKMENELRAPHAAVVRAVHVAEGVAVESGQDLVSLG